MKRYLNIYENGIEIELGIVNTRYDIMKLICTRYGMPNTDNSFKYLSQFVRYFITERSK